MTDRDDFVPNVVSEQARTLCTDKTLSTDKEPESDCQWIVSAIRDIAEYCQNNKLVEPEVILRRAIWELDDWLSRQDTP